MANQQKAIQCEKALNFTLYGLEKQFEKRQRPGKQEEPYSENGVRKLITSLFKDAEDLKDPEATWGTWLTQTESDVLNLKAASQRHKKGSDLEKSSAEKNVSVTKIKAIEYHIQDARNLHTCRGVHSALALAKVQNPWNYYQHPNRRARLIKSAMDQASGSITSNREQVLSGSKRAREESPGPSNKRARGSSSGESPSLSSLVDHLNSMDHLSVAVLSSRTWSILKNSSDCARLTDCMFKTPIEGSTDWIFGVYCALPWGVGQFPVGEVPQGASHGQRLEAIPKSWQSALKSPKCWLIYMPVKLPANSSEYSFDCICYFRIVEQASLFLPDSRIRRRDEITPNWHA
jgi:hypothetical protein